MSKYLLTHLLLTVPQAAGRIPLQAVTHLTAARGFGKKRAFLEQYDLCHPRGPPGAFELALFGNASSSSSTRESAWRPNGGQFLGHGYCAATDAKVPNDCTDGDRGAWTLPLGLVTMSAAAEACQIHCAECPRCHVFSVSTLHADCSWFHNCPQPLLTEVGGFQTWSFMLPAAPRVTEVTRAVTDGPLAAAAGVSDLSARSRPPSSCDKLILSRPAPREHDGIHLIILTPTVSLLTLPLIWHETRWQWQAARARQQLGMLTRATWIVAVGMTRREWVANPLAPAAEQAISTGQTRSLQARFCLHKSHPRSLVGADERNSVLDKVPLSNNTWLYFLDANNLLHPNFFVGIGSALTASPTARMVFFTQIRKARHTEDEIVVSRRLSGPAQVRSGQVDTGTQVIRRDLLGSVRFAMGHKDCDGVLVERLHNSLLATALGEGGIPHGELFLAEELALYNWLKCVDPETPLLRYDGVVRAGRDSVRMLPLVRGGNGSVVSSVGRGLHRECGPPVHRRRQHRQRRHRLRLGDQA